MGYWWYLVYVNCRSADTAATRCTATRGQLSKTAAFGLAPSATPFARLMATIDRLLMASARIAIRNGDLPHFGL